MNPNHKQNVSLAAASGENVFPNDCVACDMCTKSIKVGKRGGSASGIKRKSFVVLHTDSVIQFQVNLKDLVC